jgi:hypothetical protein
MARRSAKLLRFENTLYKYNTEAQTWSIDTINLNQLDKQIDISEKGTYASCKRMSQKINPILLRKGFLDAWDCLPYIDYNETKTLNNTFYFELFAKKYIKSTLKGLFAFLNKVEIKKIGQVFYINIFYYPSRSVSRKQTIIPTKLIKRYKSIFSDLTYLSKKDEESNTYYNPFFSEGPSSFKGKVFTLDTFKLAQHLETFLTLYSKKQVRISFHEQKSISDSATLLADFLTFQVENSNANFKRALRETFKEVKDKSKIKGIRINCSGRLGKAPMAKTEWFKYGQIPLSRINANLEYSTGTAFTKYGSIGVKVWVYYHN